MKVLSPTTGSAMVLQLLFYGVCVWLLQKFISRMQAINRVKKSLSALPGRNILIMHPFRTASIAFSSFFPFKGQIGHYFAGFSNYHKYGCTLIGSVLFWDEMPVYWTSDADAFRAASFDRPAILKDVEGYDVLRIYGPNMVGAEGDEFRRHKNVARSAFNEANVAFVWQEAIRLLDCWFKVELDPLLEKDRTNNGVEVDLMPVFTHLTLLVISSAGFGKQGQWLASGTAPERLDNPTPQDLIETHNALTFTQAVGATISKLFFKVLTPKIVQEVSEKVYIPWLTTSLHDTKAAFESLRSHLLDVVASARAAGPQTNADLLRNMVSANMSIHETDDLKDQQKVLTDEEMLSDSFLFLLAGHETSAHTLCFAMVLIASYPKVQEKIFQEAKALWPEGSPSPENFTKYKDSMPHLEYTQAALHETLRLHPAVTRLGKSVNQPTSIPGRRFDVDQKTGRMINVEKFQTLVEVGSLVVLDIPGLHQNPIYWGHDATEFKPERFIDREGYTWPREAFAAFSMGPRTCIGQRFAVAETVCVIAALVRRFEILLPSSYDNTTKSRADILKEMLTWKTGVTIAPKDARVRLRERGS